MRSNPSQPDKWRLKPQRITDAPVAPDASGVAASGRSAESLCRDFVARVVLDDQIDFAALWVSHRAWPQNMQPGYALTGVAPHDYDVLGHLTTDHPMVAWADAAGHFAWSIADAGSLSLADDGFNQGFFLVFAFKRTLILKLHVRAFDAVPTTEEVERIQSALADLSTGLQTLKGSGLPAAAAEEVGVAEDEAAEADIIDLEFLEATAMGDREFMETILVTCADELKTAGPRLLAVLESGDRDQLVFDAHRQRSSARTVGAETLDHMLEDLERQAASGASEEALRLQVAELAAFAIRVRRAVKDALKNMAA